MGQILEKFQGYIIYWDKMTPEEKKRVFQKQPLYLHEVELVLDDICGISPGKEWRERQLRKITDKVFYRFQNETGKANLKFEDLYIAILLIYNDINKHLPGPHFDPPSKDEIRALMQECDMNLDGELDHEEFVKFVKRVTKDTFITVSQGLIITLAVAPTVALLTKRTTEGVPGIGKVVQKIPTAAYASLVTLTVVMFQKARE